MKIPLMDLKSQYIALKKEIDEAIARVIDSHRFVLGDEVDKLEEEVADFCMVDHGVGVASGTDALFLCLKALGIKDGDEVITTPLTFVATGEAISNVGAKPVFADIDKKTYNIDPQLIEEKITPRTKAILPVHLFGQCADMDPINAIAGKYDLKVVEDSAQAIGALYKGKRAGSMSNAGCLSFFPSKNLGGFGDGGMVVTGDKWLADKIRLLRTHGTSEKYHHNVLGHNSRLDSIQAAVLRVKLRSLKGWIDERNRLAGIYESGLSGTEIITPFVPKSNMHAYHLYVIIAADRKELLKDLLSEGIEARAYYPIPLHLQKCYSSLGYKRGDLPVSEWVCGNMLAIPIYPELKEGDVRKISDKIKRFLAKREDSGVKSFA